MTDWQGRNRLLAVDKRDQLAIKSYLAALGRKGSRARAAKLSPKERREIARKAAKARWSKKRRGKK